MAGATYWTALSARVSRRRTLAGAGSAAAAAAFLAACGSGGSTETKSSGDRSGLLTELQDTTKQAKRGGVLRSSTPTIPPSYEPNLAFTGGGGQTIPHSRLTRPEPGHMKPATRNVIGDVAESWEWSPDRLQLTMKIRSD